MKCWIASFAATVLLVVCGSSAGRDGALSLTAEPGVAITPANINGSPAAFLTDAVWGGVTAIPRHLAQSDVRFTAVASSETVVLQSTSQGASPDPYFAVYQNGAYFGQVQATQDTTTYLPQLRTITGLTPGATIDIMEPSQGPVGSVSPGVPIFGGYIERLLTATPVRTVPARATVIFGNSYAGGYGGSAPNCAHGFVAPIRLNHPSGLGGVFVRQWSSNGYLVFSDGSHETAAQQAQALIDACRGSGSNEILMVALEHNDWVYNPGTPTAVGTRAAAIADAVHGLNAAVKILIATTWPNLEDGQGNAGGFTIQDYRVAVLAAASGRAWVTTLDMHAAGVLPTWNTGTDLFDASHPNDAGYAKVATALRAALPLGAF